jgi:hypothetical protein
VVLAPVTCEVLRDLVGGLAATTVAMDGEAWGFALTGDDCSDDGHPGLAGRISHRAVDLDVHLVEGLLHPLHAAGAFRDEVRHLPRRLSYPYPVASLAVASCDRPNRHVLQTAGALHRYFLGL